MWQPLRLRTVNVTQRDAEDASVSLKLLRYQGTPVSPREAVQVSTPQAAVSLLRDWQVRFPYDNGMVLDERDRPIATSQPKPARQ